MRLEVDGAVVEIRFDHTLTDSEDAHRTLVAMLRSPVSGTAPIKGRAAAQVDAAALPPG
jgi:hypothetical protein